jgi:tyrosinase
MPHRYWDWVRDWQDPASSIVFSPTEGFGGDGNKSLPASNTKGFCVDEGPFAGLGSRYFEHAEAPHCLSRNFRNDLAPGHFSGHLIRPELMKKLMAKDDYYRFLMLIETGPHNAIPAGIGGDFKSFLAPSGLDRPP